MFSVICLEQHSGAVKSKSRSSPHPGMHDPALPIGAAGGECYLPRQFWKMRLCSLPCKSCGPPPVVCLLPAQPPSLGRTLLECEGSWGTLKGPCGHNRGVG